MTYLLISGVRIESSERLAIPARREGHERMPGKPGKESAVAGTARRPNIVFILADDMGFGDFSRFNGGISRTPVLDSLMDQGVCLTQQYTGSPVCNPSRACLLTGRYPHRTGSIDTLERLALRERTLADMTGVN